MLHPPLRKLKERLAPYTLTGRFLDYRLALVLFAGSLLLGTFGYRWLEGYSLADGFYMSVITMATVGYAEVHPLSEVGRMFTSIYILANICVFAYAISAFTHAIVQGEIFAKMHIALINSDINKMKGHIILCGYGRYGRESARHFQAHGLPFVLIDSRKETIEEIRSSPEKFLYVEGDATQDEVLLQAGILRASTLVTSLNDDSDNIFTVLTARQLNPALTIVSRAHNERSARKIRLAGADHVIMPEKIGGFYMATLVTKPGAVEFFTTLTHEDNSDVTFEYLPYERMPAHLQGHPLADLRIKETTGAVVIGFRTPEGQYVANPDSTVALTPGSSCIVLGTRAQIDSLWEYLKTSRP